MHSSSDFEKNMSATATAYITHCIDLLIDSSNVICWTCPFVILEVSGLFCRFYSISDEKSC